MYKGYQLGIVVPAYNEEKLIGETLDGMPHSADRIYIIDDGSTDSTHQITKGFKDERFCILSNGYNRGVGAAITTGYKKALEENIDIVVVMAGDNQMDAKYLPELLDPIIQGKADYAKGDRLSQPKDSIGMNQWRRFGNWLLTWLTRIATNNWHINDPQNGYTAISCTALKKINIDCVYPGYGYCNDLLMKLTTHGCKIVDVPIPARYGNEKSKIKYNHYVPTVSWLLLKGFLRRLKVNLFHYDRLKLDFTLSKYESLCREILYSGYTISTVDSYLNNGNLGVKTVVLRHDVDRKLESALQMARLEQALGIRSTYYCRMNKGVPPPAAIKTIADMGHEIGYHYEVLDKAKGKQEEATQLFHQELGELRKMITVTTTCMHGNPLTKWDNGGFWQNLTPADFNLKGDAYLSMDFEKVMYYSDTGRTWLDGKFNIKDVVPAGVRSMNKPVLATTDDLIGLVQSREYNLYILVHPSRWPATPAGWVLSQITDTAVNLAKLVARVFIRREEKN
ncbi:glycosyltransferase [Chloroflexota bacterium]